MKVMTIDFVIQYSKKFKVFEDEAHQILSIHESAKSRGILLNQTRKKMQVLSLLQDELFEQAFICIEKDLYGAAHVMAWAGFIDFLEQKMSSDGLIKLKFARPGWANFKTIEEIRENIPEFQVIEASRDLGLLSKSETKTILGLLSKRNECAHPSGYKPDLNESLGYISELINRVQRLNTKSI